MCKFYILQLAAMADDCLVEGSMRPHLLRCFEERQIYIVPVTTQLPRVTMTLCKNADFCIKVPREARLPHS